MMKAGRRERIRLSARQLAKAAEGAKYKENDQELGLHFFTYRFTARGPTSAP